MSSESKDDARAQKRMPTWIPPRPMETMMDYWDQAHPLLVRNSLTRSKVRFVPSHGDKRVYAYICGPTVYDSAHMGHARAYLSFDIVRRIMEDYFGYEVFWQMNITDIDDKIIMRSREQGVSFLDLARKFELEFMEDMAALGVRAPTALTRVSEFIPQVIENVQGIIKNGFAYESNGSVYFNVPAYRGSSHCYGKLVPENVGNVKELEEGEGALSAGASDKRHPSDFALWKASKAGEPGWESPWGTGRPGWHIECSAMICDTMHRMTGGKIDIHAGGIDLRFPHHDNEIAQAEAYLDCDQWCNYFLHAGHLNIEGLKMSKSLKNFITIRSALEKYSARQVRLLFLLCKWDVTMNFAESGVAEAIAKDRTLSAFLANAKARLRDAPADGPARWGEPEFTLHAALERARAAVHAALCDDFDTPTALAALEELVGVANKYMTAHNPGVALALKEVADYVARIMGVFGLNEGVGAGAAAGASAEGVVVDREALLAPYINALRDFRQEVRRIAREGRVGDLLPLCDSLRDDVLPALGVSLRDDEGDRPAAWNLMDPEVLLAERARRMEEEEARRREKEERKAQLAAQEAEKDKKASVPPGELLRSMTDQYSQWDEQGLPTHDAAGEPLTKSALKKAAKVFKTQEKLHQKWLAKQHAK